MANITKQNLIQEIAQSTGFTQREIKMVVEQFFRVVTEKLVENATIEIRGFGTFNCKSRKARPARNLRTGETVFLKEHLVPAFKFSNEIKIALNEILSREEVLFDDAAEHLFSRI